MKIIRRLRMQHKSQNINSHRRNEQHIGFVALMKRHFSMLHLKSMIHDYVSTWLIKYILNKFDLIRCIRMSSLCSSDSISNFYLGIFNRVSSFHGNKALEMKYLKKNFVNFFSNWREIVGGSQNNVGGNFSEFYIILKVKLEDQSSGSDVTGVL